MLILRALVKQARESLHTIAFAKDHDCKGKKRGCQACLGECGGATISANQVEVVRIYPTIPSRNHTTFVGVCSLLG